MDFSKNKNNNKDIKYFINIISHGKQFPYIDIDIRKIIWYYYLNESPYILPLNLTTLDGTIDILVKLNINF